MRDSFEVIVEADRLKTDRFTVEHERSRGFAVSLDGEWFWFPALAPAYAFGRAGRMSNRVGSWSLVEVTVEVKFDHALGRDVRTLTLLRDGVGRHDADARQRDHLREFAERVDPDSNAWPAR